MIRVAVVGATGFAGEELVRILLRHPEVEIASLAAKVDKPERFDGLFPWAAGKIELVCDELRIKEVGFKADVVFLALPHRVSMEVAPHFLEMGKKVIDLSADYRLKDEEIYEKWYGVKHRDKEGLSKAVYGMPELFRRQIAEADLVANPGCYPTAAILACAPLLKEGLVKVDEIIIDSKSGVTGAGRAPSIQFHFSEVNEDLKAYKVNQHQHMPEINQGLSAIAARAVEVVFVPHLVPLNRGILSTIYLKSQAAVSQEDVFALYRKFYRDEPFVRILGLGSFPHLKDVKGTNHCDIGMKVDGKNIILVSAIDNLVKGASGQAVQNMNIMCGFQETAGL